MAGLEITESDHYSSMMIGLGSGAAVETFPVIYCVQQSSGLKILLPAPEGSQYSPLDECLLY